MGSSTKMCLVITNQTQLGRAIGRAIGQSGKKEADNAFVLFTRRTHCNAALASSPNVLGLTIIISLKGLWRMTESQI
jgi:hypothetical protein